MSPSQDHESNCGTGPIPGARSLPAVSGSCSRVPSTGNLALLPEILINLSQEIRWPLDQLREKIAGLVANQSGSITDQERAHAQTMLKLCEELDRLTRDYLGDPPPRPG